MSYKNQRSNNSAIVYDRVKREKLQAASGKLQACACRLLRAAF